MQPGAAAVTTASPLPERDSARSVQVPGAAKNRKSPDAEATTSAVNSPVPSSSRTNAPPTGCVAGQHPPGEHGLLAQVGVRPAARRLVRGAAHQPAAFVPSSIGTPISEPYSVQLPS